MSHVRQSARQRADRSVDRRQMAQSPPTAPLRRDRSGDREQDRLGRERHASRTPRPRSTPRSDAFAAWAGEEAARARRDPAQGVRADHARRRAAGEADHHRERQGALGLARRGRLRGRVLPLVRRGGGAQHRQHVGIAPASGARIVRAAQAGRHRRAGDAVEFPRRDGDAQDRPGARGRLPGRAQARVRHAAHHAGADADPGGSRRAGGRRQRHSVALVRARS